MSGICLLLLLLLFWKNNKAPQLSIPIPLVTVQNLESYFFYQCWSLKYSFSGLVNQRPNLVPFFFGDFGLDHSKGTPNYFFVLVYRLYIKISWNVEDPAIFLGFKTDRKIANLLMESTLLVLDFSTFHGGSLGAVHVPFLDLVQIFNWASRLFSSWALKCWFCFTINFLVSQLFRVFGTEISCSGWCGILVLDILGVVCACSKILGDLGF